MRKFKYLSVLLVALMLLTTACGSEEVSEDSEETSQKNGQVEEIEVWLPARDPDGKDAEIWDNIIAPFEEENNVNVKFQFISWKDYEAKYSSGISTDTGPDVGYMYVEMFPTFIDVGAVEDLTDYLTDEDYETYTVLGDKYKVFGKHYGIALSSPTAGSSVFYNKDILDEIGEDVPENWEDVIRISKKATVDKDGDGEIDQYGVAMGWGQTFSQDLNWNWYSLNWQAGSDLFDDDGKCIVNDEAGVETAQFLYDLKNTHNVLPPDVMSLTTAEAFDKYFVEGNAALAFSWTDQSSFAKLDSADEQFNYGFTYKLEGNDGDMGSKGSADAIVLMSAAEDKDLAWELVKYMTGPEGGTEYRKLTKRGPTTVGEEYNSLPQIKDALEDAEDVIRPLKAARRAPEVYDYLWKTLQEIMNDTISPKEGMDRVAEFANNMDYSDPNK